MEQLALHLSKIRIPSNSSKVYKDECVYSFDNPESETGLYVSLTSFVGMGREFVEKYAEAHQEMVYLHMKRTKFEVPTKKQGDGPEKKITRLAIGVEGGFDVDKKQFNYQDDYNVVVLPNFATFNWPNDELPDIIKTSIQAVIDLPSASKISDLEALNATWDGEARQISRHAHNLLQLENGKKIPPTGWQCEQCDKTDNLWLNLTDGSILCGRKFFDGSGGNNHAVEQFKKTGYPLAVKLGTITKEGRGDVFSYSEDDMMEDPNLVQHLSHWGINISNMEKTEKSMVELELELNKKSNEWCTMQESDGPLHPIYGPGYTGLINLGNSCYFNSVIQMMFTIPSFISKYFDGLQAILNKSLMGNNNPAEDFNVQMAKVASGLYSGKYSLPLQESSGISPSMLKHLVGKGHPEFSSKKQQDVQEFILHLLSLLERNTKNSTNPGDCFKFQVEERFQCGTSKKVKYLNRSEVILPLLIPMDAISNKEEVTAYELRKSEAETSNNKKEEIPLVRPKIKLFSCLESFLQSETIKNFYSTAVNSSVTARKTTRLTTFPDYLLIQLKKFTLREDWVPIKLDVTIDMPDVLDLGLLQGRGPQPDEEILPDSDEKIPEPVFDEVLMGQLVEMGFPPEACKRSIYFTHNSGLESATAWMMEHIADSDFAKPFVPPGTEAVQFVPNAHSVEMIAAMGFTVDQATTALRATENNLERAMDWIFSHQDELNLERAMDTTVEADVKTYVKKDGSNYKLMAFISHMGTSSMVGHYVVHILKDDQWVIFNDEKVALSQNPPKDLGYIYLYEKI